MSERKSSLGLLFGITMFITVLLLGGISQVVTNVSGAQMIVSVFFALGTIAAFGLVLIAILPVESIPYGSSPFTKFVGEGFLVASLVAAGLFVYNIIVAFGTSQIITSIFLMNSVIAFAVAFLVCIVVAMILQGKYKKLKI
jgi:hypothetical protein